MKNKINNWLFRLAKKFIAKRLVNCRENMTYDYLLNRGFVQEYDRLMEKMFYFEPNVKGRDRVYIDFHSNGYSVWHSDKKTFIANESSIEWFELYFMLIHPDNGRYELAGI